MDHDAREEFISLMLCIGSVTREFVRKIPGELPYVAAIIDENNDIVVGAKGVTKVDALNNAYRKILSICPEPVHENGLMKKHMRYIREKCGGFSLEYVVLNGRATLMIDLQNDPGVVNTVLSGGSISAVAKVLFGKLYFELRGMDYQAAVEREFT